MENASKQIKKGFVLSAHIEYEAAKNKIIEALCSIVRTILGN